MSGPSAWVHGGGGGGGIEAAVGGGRNALVKTLTWHTTPVVALAVLAATGHLLSIATNGTLLVWDYGKGVVLSKFEHGEAVQSSTLT